MRKTLLSIFSTLTFICCTFPFQVLADDDLSLAGMATYSSFNKDIYFASLWLPSSSAGSSAEAIQQLPGDKRMEFKVTTPKWRQRNFARTWSRALIISNSDTFQKTHAQEINAFSNMLKGPLIYGDKVTIRLNAGQNVTVAVNSITLFTTPKTAFFDGLLNVWVGNKPPSSEFKQAILSAPTSINSTAQHSARDEQITLTDPQQRQAVIKAWVNPPKPVKLAPVKQAIRATPKKPVQTAPKATVTAAPKTVVQAAPKTMTQTVPKTVSETVIQTPPETITSSTAEPLPVASVVNTQTAETVVVTEKTALTDSVGYEALSVKKAAKTALTETVKRESSALDNPEAVKETPKETDFSREIETAPEIASITTEQQLANDIATAKAELAITNNAQVTKANAETEAAEENFDNLILQLETKQAESAVVATE